MYSTSQKKILESVFVDDVTAVGPIEAILHKRDWYAITFNSFDSIHVSFESHYEENVFSLDFFSARHMQDCIERIAAKNGVRFDEKFPVCKVSDQGLHYEGVHFRLVPQGWFRISNLEKIKKNFPMMNI